MGKQAQADKLTALAAQVEALTDAITALTQAGKAPAPAKGGKSGRKANGAKAKNAALRAYNKSCGRMETARYMCGTKDCGKFWWSADKAKEHNLLAGHSVADIAVPA